MKKSKEKTGLTVNGVCAQILGSLSTYRNDRNNFQTINDCKVTINHLIRKFSEPAKTIHIESLLLKSPNKYVKPIREHVIPVLVIMDELLKWKDKDVEVNKENVEKLKEFLSRTIVIARITPDENSRLTQEKLHQRMPPDWEFNQHADLYARYKKADIYDNLSFSDSNVHVNE